VNCWVVSDGTEDADLTGCYRNVKVTFTANTVSFDNFIFVCSCWNCELSVLCPGACLCATVATLWCNPTW